MTPSFIGRTARIPSGVRPSIRLASRPIPRMVPVASSAATDGSFSTTPSPLTSTSVLAVPRSTAMWVAGRQVRRTGAGGAADEGRLAVTGSLVGGSAVRGSTTAVTGRSFDTRWTGAGRLPCRYPTRSRFTNGMRDRNADSRGERADSGY